MARNENGDDTINMSESSTEREIAVKNLMWGAVPLWPQLGFVGKRLKAAESYCESCMAYNGILSLQFHREDGAYPIHVSFMQRSWVPIVTSGPTLDLSSHFFDHQHQLNGWMDSIMWRTLICISIMLHGCCSIMHGK